MGGADESDTFDESLGGFAADGASVDEGEAPFPLDGSLCEYCCWLLENFLPWLTIRDVHCLTPSSDPMIAS